MKKRVYPRSVVHGKPILGELPRGWSRVRFDDILRFIERPIKLKDNVEYQLVTVKRSRGGVVVRECLLGHEVKTPTQYIIKADDFVISKRQIVHGACGIVPHDLDGAIVSNEYSVLHPKTILDLSFLGYLCHSAHFQKTCFHSSVGVHVEKMVFKVEEWLRQQIDIPPLPEQKSIAAILSAWDCAIEVLNQQILAKELRRKAAMQRLLTGRLRFPKFTGRWTTIRLGDVFKNRVDTGRQDLPLLSITADSGVVGRETLERKDTSSEDKNTYLRICPGDIGYNTMRMWQGVSGYARLEGIVSPAYTVITPDPSVDAEFMAVLFKSAPVIHLFRRYSQGLVDDTLNLKYLSFAEIKVTIPQEKDEQTQIAALFRLIDQEIALLREELAITRKQKQGLMQQLLTGKRRVNVPVAA